jgi:hypothetical protein
MKEHAGFEQDEVEQEYEVWMLDERVDELVAAWLGVSVG